MLGIASPLQLYIKKCFHSYLHHLIHFFCLGVIPGVSSHQLQLVAFDAAPHFLLCDVGILLSSAVQGDLIPISFQQPPLPS
jgi:hypothetical protein